MTPADIPLGMCLKQQAGWNQVEADWQRCLDLEPTGCFVAEWNGVPAGTTTTSVYGPVAWIAMVLVDVGHRGHGIGTALMRHAIAYLDGRGVRTIRLDATPLGRPIYEKLGFVAEYELERHQGTLPPGPAMPGVETADAADLPAIAELDRAVTATDRSKLLAWYIGQGRVRVVRRPGGVDGFLMTRRGSHALQLGPCIAFQHEVGARLFADVRSHVAGLPVYLDIPVADQAVLLLARAAGLSGQRRHLRMRRGPRLDERPEGLWASSGPENG